MFRGRPVIHLEFPQVSRLYLAAGLGMILFLLAGCAGEDAPISNTDVMQPAVQGPVTQVVGTVTNVEGTPLAEVGIAVTKGTVPVPEILILSGEDGTYIWTLPAGTFTLTATKDGYKELSQEVTVKEGETAQLDFTLEKLP